MTIETMEFKEDGGPRYKQVADAIEGRIADGSLSGGSKLPTHRALADRLGVTIGTITRAYSEAERRGLVEARIGAGTYVCQHDKPTWIFDQNRNTVDVSFGYNVPPPIERANWMAEALNTLARYPDELNELMLYQPAKGIDSHREALADWLQSQNVNARPEHMLLCHGAQHGIKLVVEALCRAGDTILVEQLCYPGLISTARQQQLTLKPVLMDDEGIVPESLEAACRLYQPRLVYLTPTLQNPTTATMSDARRAAVADVCRRHKVYILEDDVNGLLPEKRPAPLVNLAPELVIHVSGFAKFLAPGLRMGFVLAPEDLYPAFIRTLQNHSWMVSPLLSALTAMMARKGVAEDTLNQVRRDMAARWERVGELLTGFDVRYHPNGLHGWLLLPDTWPLSKFLARCSEERLDVKSAELFVPPGYAALPAVRIAVSAPKELASLEQGIATLADILASPPADEFTL